MPVLLRSASATATATATAAAAAWRCRVPLASGAARRWMCAAPLKPTTPPTLPQPSLPQPAALWRRRRPVPRPQRIRRRRWLRLLGWRMIRQHVAWLRLLPWKPAVPLAYSFSCLSGHLSFVLLAASYGFSDIWDLRVMAVAAGVAMLAFNYWHPHGQPLWLPFKWNLLFIVTNTAHLVYMWTEESRAKRLSPSLLAVFDQVLEPAGLHRVDFFKLLRRAEIRTVNAGKNLCYEGAVNNSVMLIVSGRAEVSVRGKQVYELTQGQFIGEMGIHVGLRVQDGMKSSATVTAVEPTTVISWPRSVLIHLLDEHEPIARAVQSAVSADLVRKLSREDLDASQLRPKWEHLYGVLLESTLSDATVSAHTRNMLRRYRILHRIDDGVHQRLLQRCGWTVHEFDAGEKTPPPPPLRADGGDDDDDDTDDVIELLVTDDPF